MAPFAGDLVASDMNLPVYDASASACPENYAENDAGVRCSAINGLRMGEAIRVILNAYSPPQPTPHRLTRQDTNMRTFFEADAFTPTKWNSSADKADFGNKLLHLLLNDCQQSLFTQELYDRLMNCFGHIAHYNRDGFFAEWFSSPQSKAEFVRHLLSYPCWGDADFTYSDVERAIQSEVKRLNLLAAYQERAAAAIRSAELALLSALQRKYQPAMIVPIAEPVSVPTPQEAVQLSLIA
jgi:hypothetical protein